MEDQGCIFVQVRECYSLLKARSSVTGGIRMHRFDMSQSFCGLNSEIICTIALSFTP